MEIADGEHEIVNEYLSKQVINVHLTPGQIAEIKRRLSYREPFATGEEVRRTLARLTKSRKRP